MTWFYNSYNGSVANESPPAAQYFILEADLHEGQGLHAYGTQAEMLAAIKANGWPAPTSGPPVPDASNAGQVASHAASAAAGDIFHGLNLNNWLLRGGEILVGIVLIGIGVNAMFKGKPLQVVTGAASTVGKVVP